MTLQVSNLAWAQLGGSSCLGWAWLILARLAHVSAASLYIGWGWPIYDGLIWDGWND